MVAHNFATDHIGLNGCIVNTHIHILEQRTLILILLVVAVAVGVESRCRECPAIREPMIYDQLVIDLQIVVGLVVVIIDVRAIGQNVWAVRGFVLSLGVVTAAVELHLLLGYTRIGEVGFGLTAERDELHRSARTVICSLQHIRLQIRRSAIDVAVRADVREACIDHPAIVHKTRSDVDGLFVGVVGAVREGSIASKSELRSCRCHTHRATESSRSVGRGTRSALHLHIAYGRDHVGRVVPIGRMGVGVVERHSVDRYVKSRGIRTTQANRCSADADTRLVGGNHRGRKSQKRRDVQTVIVAGDLLLTQVGIGYGGSVGSASGYHFDFLNLIVERD